MFQKKILFIAIFSGLGLLAGPAWGALFGGKSGFFGSSTPAPKPAPAASSYSSAPAVSGRARDEGWDYLADLLEATDMDPVENSSADVQRYGDVWQRIRRGFRMDLNQENARIASQRNWFITRQPYLDRLAARASRYLYHTVTEAEKRGIPTELALLPVIESSYDPGATSSAAAAGLWQFIPGTGKIYGLRQTQWFDARRDVVQSTRAAYDFLGDLHRQFGSWELALAAYNAGPGRVQQAIRRNIMDGLPTDYWSLRLPEETMNYVPRFLAVAQIIRQPQEYGVTIMPIANRVHFRQVSVPGQISLETIARTLGISTQEFYQLNPGFRQGYTDPGSNNIILVPDSTPKSVERQLAALRPSMTVEGMLAQNNPAPVVTSGTATFTPNTGLPQSADALARFASRQTTGTAASAGTITTAPAASASTAIVTGATSALDKARAAARFEAPKGVFAATAPKIGATSVRTGESLDPMARQYGQPKELNIPVEHVRLSSDSGSPPAPVTQPLPPVSAGPAAEPPLGALPTDSTAATEAPRQLVFVEPVYAARSLPATAAKAKTVSQGTQDKPEPKATVRNPALKRLTYRVQAGDTLRSIAEEYGVTMKQLEDWNQISREGTLLRGNMLYIYADKTAQTPKTRPTTYVVQAGDSLTGLAGRFGLSVQELASFNDLGVRDDLKVGDKLSLVDTPKRSAKPASYTVRRGDTLHSIADRFDLSVQELAELNHRKVNYEVRSGETLAVSEKAGSRNGASHERAADKPGQERKDRDGKSAAHPARYTVKAGDTLTEVANRFGMSRNDLAEMNDLKPTADLLTGRVLVLSADRKDKDKDKDKESTARDTSSGDARGRNGSSDSTDLDLTRYKVKKGDTWTSVARRAGLTTKELGLLNRKSPSGTLAKGTIILLPAGSTGGGDAEEADTRKSPAGQESRAASRARAEADDKPAKAAAKKKAEADKDDSPANKKEKSAKTPAAKAASAKKARKD